MAREEARTISCPERAQMLTLAGKFGMTPSDRAKMAVETAPASKLSKFLAVKPPKPAPVHPVQ
jgi:hypothetical protein